ncbi:MAG TPA: sialate O-acetylesterase [Fimbriimonas sp.]|nr:sialate O-acetylesterase [Fimbriimonas sp.]
MVLISAAFISTMPMAAEKLKVFIFAGQSNMVGSDSRASDIKLFPPFVGLDSPQTKVKFSYTIGREEKLSSTGWTDLQPISNVVGPELSFARKVAATTKAPIAIIKCAAGGTTLAVDWNPDQPGGFRLYPLALSLVKSSLAELDKKGIPYSIEGFMWHQGENDMFNPEFKANYAKNLKNFLSSWRRDLNTPKLKFYIGELCTKTVWGMDNRENMYAIRAGQLATIKEDKLARYIPTSQNAVEIGGGAGLHYHYGTLGQLQHGIGYADAYLKDIGKLSVKQPSLKAWPYPKKSKVKLFVFAGHRNMEGERAFVQDLSRLAGSQTLAKPNPSIAFKYSIGGGYRTSMNWQPLSPVGISESFGPELSFAAQLQKSSPDKFAILKFTDSGSQMNDWTPEGTSATDRNVYQKFVSFVQNGIRDLQNKGHEVELAGVFYHVGENDMSFGPYRRQAAKWLQSLIVQSRRDLGLPNVKWFVSQQPPTEDKGLNAIDVTKAISELALSETGVIHIKAFDLPKQPEQLVLNTQGVIHLGELMAQSYLKQK